MTGTSCEPCRTPTRRESKTAHTEIVVVVVVVTVLQRARPCRGGGTDAAPASQTPWPRIFEFKSADRTHKQVDTSVYRGSMISGVGDGHLRRTVMLGELVGRARGKEMTPKATAASCETGATGWRRGLWNRGHTREWWVAKGKATSNAIPLWKVGARDTCARGTMGTPTNETTTPLATRANVATPSIPRMSLASCSRTSLFPPLASALLVPELVGLGFLFFGGGGGR